MFKVHVKYEGGCTNLYRSTFWFTGIMIITWLLNQVIAQIVLLSNMEARNFKRIIYSKQTKYVCKNNNN